MPPWPHPVIAAGYIVPPVLAPDMAPLPLREDAALAAIVRKTALQRVTPETTLAAQANPRTARADAGLRAPAARWGGPRAPTASRPVRARGAGCDPEAR